MAPLLKLRQAARPTGLSPGRLYRAIPNDRLMAAPGGGPGKPTLANLEAVQTCCRSEGLRVPDASESIERAERSIRPADEALALQALETLTGQYLAQIMARQSDYIETFLRGELSHLVEQVAECVVDQVVERLAERFTTPPPRQAERSERTGRVERSTPAVASPKAAVLQRLRAMQAEGLSLQAMANRLNAEG
jgi:hypothetical protein